MSIGVWRWRRLRRTAVPPLVARRTKNGGNVLQRLAHPHRLEFGIADEQQPAAERVRDGFSADRLACARRTSKVEGERQPGGIRSPSPQRLKMRSCCVTCARAVSSARRVAGGRITSSNVRRGTIDSTARRPLIAKNRVNGIEATATPYRLSRAESNRKQVRRSCTSDGGSPDYPWSQPIDPRSPMFSVFERGPVVEVRYGLPPSTSWIATTKVSDYLSD